MIERAAISDGARALKGLTVRSYYVDYLGRITVKEELVKFEFGRRVQGFSHIG